MKKLILLKFEKSNCNKYKLKINSHSLAYFYYLVYKINKWIKLRDIIRLKNIIFDMNNTVIEFFSRNEISDNI